jgi:hypothetical protein
MTQHYRANRFQSKQASFIGGGEIVAAYKDVDEKWYRARVIETCTVHEMDPDDMNEQTCVIQFVDYGDKAVLPANELRRIEKRFLQLPFQVSSEGLLQIINFWQGPPTLREQKSLPQVCPELDVMDKWFCYWETIIFVQTRYYLCLLESTFYLFVDANE